MGLLDGLNEQQREAALATEGPLLILAGAGSGKTRTIIHRIAYILEQGLAWPSQILAITFTNKAAGEMRDRIAAMDIPETNRIWMYTFHAMCARIMRMHAKLLGYGDNFVIYDTDDQKRLYKQIAKELDLSDKQYPFGYVIGEISAAKEKGMLPNAFDKLAAGDFRLEKVALFYHRYREALMQNNAMDFDDLILNTLILFKEQPEILAGYQQRFKYILVDEYQDTNHSQYELVNLLAGGHRNLCVCGDDDQSIYGWRGADIRNILDFEKDYPDAKVVKLEENYRSTPVILEAANGVIANNTGRKEKNLWTHNPGSEKIAVSAYDQGNEEADAIADEIERLRRDEAFTYGDCAVLYRTNAQSRLFEEAFMRRTIPYQLVGGTGFYARMEVKDIVTYLHVLLNPADNLGTVRIINTPKRGIGGMTIQKLQDFADFKGYSLMDAVLNVEAVPTLSAGIQTKVRHFADMMQELIAAAAEESVAALIKHVIDATGYLTMLEMGKVEKAEARIENLQELISSAADFEKNSDDTSLTAYLETVALTSETDKYETDEGKVLLMTLHNAKGLEFPVVFMPGMEDGIFPNARSFDDPAQMEEERRICYVGITRAEKKLYLSHASERTVFGRRQPQIASRFLRELPADCIHEEEHRSRDAVISEAGKRANQTFGRRPSAFGANLTYGKKKKAAPDIGSGTNNYQLSDKVKHKKFGVGTIVEVKAHQISVAFPGVGIKKLDPGFVLPAD
ncbi:putative ATP-dependent DNA helicase PcrA [Pseudoramibacter alactolyticus ATCC 23263]|uniref:DNA 3'-5' helicase n=1 Tax=Pseudoramibacter alactolyticus ATCC 23263 TaxID=887929 RepID=E6MET8_9FIRM|nr:UvrD-helicase domain-containing protein [Pseudoramibacter alactolyticus]EFV02376.1 putative ATP-dependent DNA helicase PcrA [Pseudoramibacter alactolyticus ATCC 23263]